MPFTSYTFLFLGLPIAVAGFEWVRQRGDRRLTKAWLVVASLVFYGWWNPLHLPLLLGSIGANYVAGWFLASDAGPRAKRWVLTAGVAGNLGLLLWFKYAMWLAATATQLTGTTWSAGVIALPIAISFYTFQQIAFLVDAYRGLTRDVPWLDYVLFVSFFPQLVAGPIVHHGEMLPQFATRPAASLRWSDRSVGLTIFAIGLAKKLLIADNVARFADPVFDSADLGVQVTQVEAAVATLAYTFQLYFDFSGYSDMAIGMARVFGIRLPLNFDAPYRAADIATFWRRWHMTLSRFLRDYLYIPLGGNRRGRVRRYVNLMTTMVLGGLWHGAGWNFAIWGFLHGLYLVVHQAWRAALGRLGVAERAGGPVARVAGIALTFVVVALAWVPFRAVTLAGAGRVLGALVGLGASFPTAGLNLSDAVRWLALCGGIAFFLPTTQRWMADDEPSLDGAGVAEATWLGTYRPRPATAVLTAVVIAACVVLVGRGSPFIYYRF